jgi:hypothetical protein
MALRACSTAESERGSGAEKDRCVPAPGEYDLRLRDTAIESNPVAQLVVDAAGLLTIINERARALFSLRSSDAGQPFRELKLASDPVELSLLIEMAEAERRSVFATDIYWPSPTAEDRWLDLQIAPLTNNDGTLIGTALSFTDVTANRLLQRELEHSERQLEAAYEMLRSINRVVETMNKELRAINDELQPYLSEEGRQALELSRECPEDMRQVYVQVRHADEHWDEREQLQPRGTGPRGLDIADRRAAVHRERRRIHRTVRKWLDH